MPIQVPRAGAFQMAKFEYRIGKQSFMLNAEGLTQEEARQVLKNLPSKFNNIAFIRFMEKMNVKLAEVTIIKQVTDL